MLNEIKATLYYLGLDMKFSFKVFWSILILTTSAAFLLALTLDIKMIFVTSAAIYIFCGITGSLTTKETFPYCIKLGATRTNYTLSVLIYCAAVAFIFSLINVGVISIFKGLMHLNPSNQFFIYHIVEATSLANAWYNQLLVDAIVCFVLLSLGFLLGTIFYRLGLIGGFTTIAVLFIAVLIPYTRDAILDLILNMHGWQVGVNFLLIIGLALVAYLPNWGLLRKASTISNATR
ncbi:hypothetical protein [Sutcliffiella rhizosphaerae]|uniref:Uncharacterized protein n=1 Tax=Sutcliffiella rhizosphaerae TaxID=2880967 RepID=A0ABN8AK39_9BACI|nr:hypothetical protein [Sutcliffiella rhizosphaerae]CAG9623528.1 hypothetical protein BACCIP111883_04344 [Sutcliffiella rhizosphaerae]